MFYPSKISSFDSSSVGSMNSLKEHPSDDKFLDLLKTISDGPLIKYWRQLQ